MRSAKVLKMGNKVGIYIGNDYENIFKIKKGNPIELKIQYKNKKFTSICRMNYNIVLRKSFEYKLASKKYIKFEIRRIRHLKRPRNIFHKNKIDMLSLVPLRTSNGYELLATQFKKNREKYLRVWYSHGRGSGRQFEIKRYVDIKSFSTMLGQYQAEGTKKETLVEFTNTLMSEHKDFTESLKSIGIEKIEIFPSTNAYRTVVRYSALAAILLNSMNTVRSALVSEEIKGNLKVIADSYFSKVLIGDGTIDIGKRKVPQVAIKIVDINRKTLIDYKIIMEKLGFKPHINFKRIWVRSSCSLENLIYLYKIEAFRNSNNWNKLIISIKMLLEGRRLNTLYRFSHLRNVKDFTSLNIKNTYSVGLRAANDWIENNVKGGYIQKSEDSRPIKYKLTQKAYDLAGMLEKIEMEFKKIKKNKDSTSLSILLDSFKTRNHPKSALIQGQATY